MLPVAKPWYALSNQAKCCFAFMTAAISFQSSWVGSTPVGLWAQAWSKMMEAGSCMSSCRSKALFTPSKLDQLGKMCLGMPGGFSFGRRVYENLKSESCKPFVCFCKFANFVGFPPKSLQPLSSHQSLFFSKTGSSKPFGPQRQPRSGSNQSFLNWCIQMEEKCSPQPQRKRRQTLAQGFNINARIILSGSQPEQRQCPALNPLEHSGRENDFGLHTD